MIKDLDLNRKGKKCGCICPECRLDLVAVRGEVYEAHFRHMVEDNTCKGSDETLLHKLAKEIIV